MNVLFLAPVVPPPRFSLAYAPSSVWNAYAEIDNYILNNLIRNGD